MGPFPHLAAADGPNLLWPRVEAATLASRGGLSLFP